jgi:copper chaperone CopZ
MDMPTYRVVVVIIYLSLGTATASAFEDKHTPNKQIKHQITGLFSADREQDLRDVFEMIPQIKLVSIDFKNAEATFEYDPAKVFPNAKPDEILQKFDALLKNASNHTFGIKPLRTVPLEKLKLIEIPVVGLDCKACCLAAYEAVYKLEGVERATASFREGRVTVLIDPEKTDRTKLEAALKKLGVQLKAP